MSKETQNFRVPYGVDELGHYVSPTVALKQTAYFCPCCSNRLIFRSGTKRAKHFSHPKIATCNPETVLHKTAKALIQRAITGNAGGYLSLSIINNCQSCGEQLEQVLKPNTFSKAVEELRVGQYICDVVAFRGDDEIVLGIEVLVTHAVDEQKAKNLSLYWIELKAEDVIKSETIWKPVQSRLKQGNCQKCKKGAQKFRLLAKQYGIDDALVSTNKLAFFSTKYPTGYLGFTGKCWSCKRDIPLFWWAGVPFCTEKPPEPRPKTIQFKFSKTYGKPYWANTCAGCGMLQGDNFLENTLFAS